MIADAEKRRDFCAILVWDQDRFGRFDSIEAGRWVYPLREAGVLLVTVAQGQIDWTDFTGRMMYSIQQEGKHQFLVDLSRNVLRGKLNSAKKGHGSGAPPIGFDRAIYDQAGGFVRRVPYGESFQRPSGWSVRFVVSEDTELVRTIRWVFQTFAETDCGFGWIAGELNRRGVPTPRGAAWCIQTIRAMLANETYTGSNVFGKIRHGKYHHLDGDGQIADGRATQRCGKPIVHEGVHEVLIDRKTFDLVQSKLAERRRTGQRPRHNRYLLSGLLRCGACGGALAGKTYPSGHRYYGCVTGTSRPGVCHRYQVRQEPIEGFVLQAVADRLNTDAAVQSIQEAIHRRAKQCKASHRSAGALRSKIAAFDRKIEKGTANLLLADPDDVPEMSRLLATWRADRDRLRAELEAMARNPDGAKVECQIEAAVAEIEHLQEHLRAGEPTRVRAVFRALIGEIRLWWAPCGKRGKRLARGIIQWRTDLAFISRGS